MRTLDEIIMDRRSIRRFNTTPVTREELAGIVEAGRWAPTAGNCQTVRFTVVTTPSVLEELRRRVQAAFAAMPYSEELYISIKGSIRQSQKGGYVYDYHAPVLVIVSNEGDYPNAIADSACALQNMMLMAESLEVGSCWINQLHWLEHHPDLRAYLETIGIGRDKTICGALALGHYDAPQARKPRTGMVVDYV